MSHAADDREPVRAARAWRLAHALLALTALLAWSAAAPAQQLDTVKVAQVKAAYLVNFLRYTNWPPSAFASAEAPFRVTVIGDDAVAAELTLVARRGTAVQGRRLDVQRIELPAPGRDGALGSRQREQFYNQLARTHLLYLGAGAKPHVAAILDGVGRYDALTVGDTQGFAASGGMIGLVLEGTRIVFDANPGAIRRTGLRVSAKVLKLARTVRQEADG